MEVKAWLRNSIIRSSGHRTRRSPLCSWLRCWGDRRRSASAISTWWNSTTGGLARLRNAEGPIRPQHYAFLISEADFDAVLGRIRERALDHWADPARHRPGEINQSDGGRGVYFPDPDGHHLEVITRPYGSGAS